jgi:hypothetical protein
MKDSYQSTSGKDVVLMLVRSEYHSDEHNTQGS